MNLTEIIDYVEGTFLKTEIDINYVYNVINTIKHYEYLPITDDIYSLENIYDYEYMDYQIPSKELLTFWFGEIAINTLNEQQDLYFLGLTFIYNNDNTISVNYDELNNLLEHHNKLLNELTYDKENILPTKKYVGNCSKEFCEKIVDENWEREYNKIKDIDFPPTEFIQITPQRCINEIKKLINKPGKLYQKGYSSLIKYFHKSIIHANVSKNLSPYDGWQYIKSDVEVFKDFYRNRLRCSDWFKSDDHINHLVEGWVMLNTYGIGLTTSRKYPLVTYFKPRLAKYIVEKYLNEFNTIFDPFSGYSGRMLGALAANKNYIGQDLCESSVKESNEMYDFIKPYIGNVTAEITVNDTVKSNGVYECLFTCPPYENIENWPGVKSVGYNCDKWIDICLSNFECEKYVFVVDNKIEKYKKYIKEELVNTSHLADNSEYIVVITKDDLKNIYLTIEGDTLEFDENYTKKFSNLGILLYNNYNKQIFNRYIPSPKAFENWHKLIYNKFNNSLYGLQEYELPHISLNNTSNTVLLALSGGLDSTYQIVQLRKMGYDVICYHVIGANTYENAQATKQISSICNKLNCNYVTIKLHRNLNSNYSKHWAENPIKNQMILFTMIDFCYAHGLNKICMDGSWEFGISEVTAGVDVADAPENYELWLKGILNYVDNLEFIKTPHDISKFDKIKTLDKLGLMDSIYSCLGPGKFNKMRHNNAETKYGIKLFENNCGHSCRKCAHHNLLMHYSGYKTFPDEFIIKCWNILNNNGFASRNMLFGDDIPLEQKINNLYVE